MPPFHLALLSADTLHQRRTQLNKAETPEAKTSAAPDTTAQSGPETARSAPAQPHSHSSPSSRPTRHRVTSHYNAFQTTCSVATDAPPSYAAATRLRPTPVRSLTEGSEPLPKYQCTVAFQGEMCLNLESQSPLSHIGEGEWREVYVVLRGTLLSMHRVKNGGAGRLLATYTLQHAEAGLAPDAQHVVLLPQTRLASLIPQSARKRAWHKDPELFKQAQQTVLRLRLETDQMLLAGFSEQSMHDFLYALGAAIDIAHPIDERSIPRQCTVPRRRRRPRQQFNGDITDPALIAEQERIMRQMYPGLYEARTHTQDEAQSNAEPERPAADSPQTPAREEEEIDFSMIREEAPAPSVSTAEPQPLDSSVRPTSTRQATNSSINSTFSDDMIYATHTSNFDSERKWHPPHLRSAAQVERYTRRCLPVLLAEANRASDIVIEHGRRKKINWRMELLEDWELQPPTYKSHNFSISTGLARSNSQRSATESTSQAALQSSGSITAASEDDHITQIDQGMDHLALSKVVSTTDKAASNMLNADRKGRVQQPLPADVHGVVFCF